jgi:hypothetical protein
MRTLYALLAGLVLIAASVHGQSPQPATPSGAPAAPVKEIVLTATTANVKDSGTPVTIRLLRWSTDEERTALIAAFTAQATGRPGGGGRAGTPAGAGAGQPQRGQGQGRASQPPVQEQPQQDQDDAQDQAPDRPQGQAGQGRPQGAAGLAQPQAAGAGRGGRGGAPPATVTSPFMQAIQRAPKIGYLWTNEPTGYSVNLAWHESQPDGSERVVILTAPRLGTYSPAWTMKAGTVTDYAFTLLEFRISAKTAEGKSSLTSKIVADPNTHQLALEDFSTAPAILTKVKLTTK